MFTIEKPHLFLSLFIFTIVSLGFQSESQAKTFRNSYVSFQLPDKWDCYLENTAWICRYKITQKCLGANAKSQICKDQREKQKEAIIILAAKEKGPKDSLLEYDKHLKTPRDIVTKQGKRTKSKIIHARTVSIEKQKWNDGMHLGSEIPYYYTRYLATVKGNIAVLVTFSAHKLYYSKYSTDFFNAIKSLRVLATKAQSISKRELHSGKGTLGANIGTHLDVAIDEAGDGWDVADQGGGSTTDTFLMVGAILLALAGIYVWMRGRR